jgi:hypothetical protein
MIKAVVQMKARTIQVWSVLIFIVCVIKTHALLSMDEDRSLARNPLTLSEKKQRALISANAAELIQKYHRQFSEAEKNIHTVEDRAMLPALFNKRHVAQLQLDVIEIIHTQVSKAFEQEQTVTQTAHIAREWCDRLANTDPYDGILQMHPEMVHEIHRSFGLPTIPR